MEIEESGYEERGMMRGGEEESERGRRDWERRGGW